jgi:hypothetical protein
MQAVHRIACIDHEFLTKAGRPRDAILRAKRTDSYNQPQPMRLGITTDVEYVDAGDGELLSRVISFQATSGVTAAGCEALCALVPPAVGTSPAD